MAASPLMLEKTHTAIVTDSSTVVKWLIMSSTPLPLF